tara:strand:- start:321 stop:734 length:414 start_codon:yes stop_codon:yes gene_type:complete
MDQTLPVKCITTYVDIYANTGFGHIVAMCTIQNNEKTLLDTYTIQEPISVKKRWETSYGFQPLPENLAKQYPVGFYTTGSHYRIMKMIGYADFIENTKFYEKLSKKPDYDKNCYTWYSNGLTLKEGISETQTHLYHL